MSTEPSAPYVLKNNEGDPYWFLDALVTLKANGAATSGGACIAEFLQPAGSATPLHMHPNDDESFYILAGTAKFSCDGKVFVATAGAFIFLPRGLPHAFLVDPDAPMRMLVLNIPSGFENFVAAASRPATERRLPDDMGPHGPEELGRIAAAHGVVIVGLPPTAL